MGCTLCVQFATEEDCWRVAKTFGSILILAGATVVEPCVMNSPSHTGLYKHVILLQILSCYIFSHTQDGVTALSMAVQEQHTAVVDALLLAGANVDLAEYVRTVV